MYPICIEILSNTSMHETLLKMITLPYDNLICIVLNDQLVCCLDKLQFIIQFRKNFVDSNKCDACDSA